MSALNSQRQHYATGRISYQNKIYIIIIIIIIIIVATRACIYSNIYRDLHTVIQTSFTSQQLRCKPGAPTGRRTCVHKMWIQRQWFDPL